MPLHYRRGSFTMFLALAGTMVGLVTLGAQAPLPVAGQRGQGPAPAQQGQPAAALPQTPTVSPLASISPAVNSPGQPFSSLMSLPTGSDMTHFKYEATEYFVSGTANGQPYKTRMVIRRPSENSRFSGIVLAESMHPSGNAWMFHFTYAYTMTAGHAAVEIVTSDPAQFVAFNGPRYKDLSVKPGQANEILAQVGALVRSKQPDNPLAALTVRKMILAGTSASAAVIVNYLPAHMVYRLA